MEKVKFETFTVYIVSFFIYAGYYIGLSIIFTTENQHLSRFYSIPLRLGLSFIMLYFIYKSRHVFLNNYKVILLLLYFSFYYIIKILYTENSGAYLVRPWYEYILFYFIYCLIPFLYFSSIDYNKYYNTILNAFLQSGIILGLLSLIIFKDALAGGGVGRISMLSHETGKEVISPLALAYSGALTFLLSLYKLIYQKVNLFSIITCIIALLSSGLLFLLGSTRGALLGILLGITLLILYSDFRRKFLIIGLMIATIPLIYIGIESTGSSILDRTTDTLQTGESSGRDVLWREAFTEFLNNPIFGGRIEVSGIYPHNIFLELLMSTGVIGLFLFLQFLYLILKRNYKQFEIKPQYLIAALILTIGIAQHLVTGALWGAITLFAGLGLLNTLKKGK